MKITVYNQEGKAVSEALLPKEIFEVPFNSDLVSQVVNVQKNNRRQVIAHTKDRSEVRGGGKKPWKQKGTGRARHGSTRSPIWKGGGVAFGPRKQRIFKREIPLKMKRKALFMVLSAKAKESFLIVLDKIEIENIKTKTFFNILKKLPCKGKNCLISFPKLDKKMVLSARNLPKVKTVETRNLNALDLLSFKYLILPKESVKVIRETFLK